MKKNDAETDTSTSDESVVEVEPIKRKRKPRLGTPADPNLGRIRPKVTERCIMYDFVYTCAECGLEAILRDYTRPESRLCGRCDRKMSMRKVQL